MSPKENESQCSTMYIFVSSRHFVPKFTPYMYVTQLVGMSREAPRGIFTFILVSNKDSVPSHYSYNAFQITVAGLSAILLIHYTRVLGIWAVANLRLSLS